MFLEERPILQMPKDRSSVLYSLLLSILKVLFSFRLSRLDIHDERPEQSSRRPEAGIGGRKELRRDLCL